MNGLVYQRLQDYCDSKGRSVSGYIEEFVVARLDAEGVPVPMVLKPRNKRRRESLADEIQAQPSQYFTF